MTSLQTEVKASGLLLFAIDSVRYGLPSDDVTEVTMAVAISPLPKAEGLQAIEGIVNFHGELAAVIDLRTRFRHEARSLSAAEHFIFTRAGKHLVALRADRVIDLIKAPVEALDLLTAPPRTSEQGRSLAGVSKLSDGVVLIFDMANFLSASEAQTIEAEISRRKAMEREARQSE
jgi:chemotaxis signal transduction protein